MAEYTETKEWQTLDSDGHGMTIDIGVSSVCVYYTLTPPLHHHPHVINVSLQSQLMWLIGLQTTYAMRVRV